MTRGEPDARRRARPVRRAGRGNRPAESPDTAPRPDPYRKLKGPAKWTCFYLYVILDVFSRYAVGWTVQYRENGQLAKALIEQAAEQQQIEPRPAHRACRPRQPDALQAGRVPARRPRRHQDPQPALHLDRQPLQRSAASRRSSTGPSSPTGSTTSTTPARSAATFFDWYNHHHRHSGIGLMTPAAVHHGQAPAAPRRPSASVLDAAYAATPSGSSASHPHRPSCRPPRGSTSPQTRRRSLTKFVTRRLTGLDRLRSTTLDCWKNS